MNNEKTIQQIIDGGDVMEIANAALDLAEAYGNRISTTEEGPLRPWAYIDGRFMVFTKYPQEAQELMDFILKDGSSTIVLGEKKH